MTLAIVVEEEERLAAAGRPGRIGLRSSLADDDIARGIRPGRWNDSSFHPQRSGEPPRKGTSGNEGTELAG